MSVQTYTVEEMDRAVMTVDAVRARTANVVDDLDAFHLPPATTLHYADAHARHAVRRFPRDISARQAFMVGWMDGLCCGIALAGEVKAE